MNLPGLKPLFFALFFTGLKAGAFTRRRFAPLSACPSLSLGGLLPTASVFLCPVIWDSGWLTDGEKQILRRVAPQDDSISAG